MAVMPNGDTDEDSTWSNNDNYDGKYEHFATEAPLLITLVLPVLIGAILIIKCVFTHCCMRHTPTKEELFGVHGRVTALSSDEPVIAVSATPLSSSTPDVNHTLQSVLVQSGKRDKSTNDLDAIVGSIVSRQFKTSSLVLTKETKFIKQALASVVSAPLSSTSASSNELVHESSAEVLGDVSQDCTDTLKRATLHRQLPEPPQNNVEVQRNARRSNSILSHDETSELYATVGDVPNLPSTSAADSRGPFYDPRAGDKSDGNKKRGSKQADTTISSDSETYANNPSNHPYAKLKRVHEHPYARVGPNRSSVGGDEETDTDNYDTPHPYAVAAGGTNAAIPGPSRSENNGSTSAAAVSPTAGLSSSATENPVPPRRAARLWRRSNNPHVAENQQHFSGDSQDSRGYTSISVREPLSNIIQKGANVRNQDGFYASVSDDSEEMYAAIEDPEGNYMRIPGDDPHRPWLNAVAPNLHSPIPERREANSPLPPPPAVPLLLTTDNPVDSAVPAGDTEPTTSNPPVYAQVTKKSKKPKQQSSLTSSQVDSIQPAISIINSSVSSSISNDQVTRSSTTVMIGENVNSVTASNVGADVGPEVPVSQSSVETPSEPRRWSKADISFSEFEVVREPLYCTPDQNHIAEKRKKKSRSSKAAERKEPVEPESNGFAYVDDDNYNVIPEPTKPVGIAVTPSTAGRKPTKKPKNIYNDVTSEEPVDDYYQEIGPSSSAASNRGHQYNSIRPEALYHQIEAPPRRVEPSTVDDDDEVGDEFYEAVKPAPKPPPKTGSSAEERYNRKHGYEKLKKKNSTDTPVAVAVDDDDDDDEDDDDEDGTPGMYEKLKYPPYARLKESRDSLSIASAGEDANERNFYETIGYSRSQAKAANSEAAAGSTSATEEPIWGTREQPSTSVSANVQQLYSVVNKPKKKKKEVASSVQENGSNDMGAATESTNVEDHVAANGDYSRGNRIVFLRDVQDDNSIEYI